MQFQIPFEKASLVHEPTPLVFAPRASERLGIELWVKRDDVAGPSFGGNKSRQLEYYIGDALHQNADTVLITGAVQSNFARIAAAAARNHGLNAVVQLEDRVAGKNEAYHSGGNVLLSHILGADILTYPEGEDEAGADAALHAHAEILRAKGCNPYIIHLSEGHPPIGALGYAEAAQEIINQAKDFDTYVVGSGSGSTHTGLLAGLRGLGSSAQVIGGCVRRPAVDQTARITRMMHRLGDLYDGAKRVAGTDIILDESAFHPGYGQPGPLAMQAMQVLAQTEGLILDPVYTAKSFGSLMACIENGMIEPQSRVCFVHTGGLAAVFSYGDTIRSGLPPAT